MKLPNFFTPFSVIRVLTAVAFIYVIYTLVCSKDYRNKRLSRNCANMMNKERFAAFSTSPLVDITQLDPKAYYKVGTRIKSNTTSEARYGGTPCIEFPTTIYVPVPKVDAKCLSYTNPPVLDDTYYSFSSTDVLGSNIGLSMVPELIIRTDKTNIESDSSSFVIVSYSATNIETLSYKIGNNPSVPVTVTNRQANGTFRVGPYTYTPAGNQVTVSFEYGNSLSPINAKQISIGVFEQGI